jgi:purine-nucleoside phosphorylase
MKTPKDKAFELLQRYGILGINWECTGYYSLPIENAKECALILVDEILKTHVATTYEYWEEVRVEIENFKI